MSEQPTVLSENARALLDGPNIAVLATLMPGGEPQTTAVWVARDGDDTVVIATTETLKLKNMRRDRRVSLTIIDRDDPYLELNARGQVVDIDADAGKALIDELSQSYYGTTPYPYHQEGQTWFAVRIRLDRVRTNR
jgi:PPOX class probable F420-dependent enzyme